jgi:hypothetical protein
MRIPVNEFSDREAIRGFARENRHVLAHKSASFETRELLVSYAADAATSVAVCALSGPTKLFAEEALPARVMPRTLRPIDVALSTAGSLSA